LQGSFPALVCGLAAKSEFRSAPIRLLASPIATTLEIRRPQKCAVRRSRGSPPNRVKREKERKSSPRFLPSFRGLPHYPLIYGRRPGPVFVCPVRHGSPTPDSSRNERKCRSHLGERKTQAPPGSLPSHAFALAFRRCSLVQRRSTCDLVIREPFWQNQHCRPLFYGYA